MAENKKLRLSNKKRVIDMDPADKPLQGVKIDLALPDPPVLGHFDDASYGTDEDANGFRERVRDALVPIKLLIDDCEEIWSPVGQGIPYVRGMAIVVQELNRVSSNAAGRILVYTGWQKFEEVEDDD